MFGGSGRTGKELILQLLAHGHIVTAVVRHPGDLGLRYERLQVVEGDALKPESFDAALEGNDAVLSTLGVSGFFNSLRPMTFYRDSIAAIIDRMQVREVRRLVLVSSVGVRDDPSTPIWYRTIVRPMLRHKYENMRQMEQRVAASGLAWTIVRAARLVDGPLTQRYRIGDDGSLTNVTKVSRSDLADFMAREVQDAKRIGRAVAISY
ncbi:SDR family oxidoreductase [Bradyrhizobium sp. INPA01-394B]|uniref:NAD(P)-dependent oxidoreductase n=1 Tax=Bradyrhizobium campsiandrae TaxID=1729892 RepID=UPI00165FC2C6|nr:SDR family oxidoreductase [Bradyrhizobium campsiandrae]